MRSKIKFIALVAGSIDGRIAKDERSLVWTSKEDQTFFQGELAKFDAVIVGRNTYKLFSKSLNRRNTFVFTSRVDKIEKKGSVTFLNPEKTSIVNILEQDKHKKVAILGGPRIYDFFLKKKMLHELFVTLEPCVFSAGVPMFSGNYKKQDFILSSVKRLNKQGTLLLKYSYVN